MPWFWSHWTMVASVCFCSSPHPSNTVCTCSQNDLHFFPFSVLVLLYCKIWSTPFFLARLDCEDPKKEKWASQRCTCYRVEPRRTPTNAMLFIIIMLFWFRCIVTSCTKKDKLLSVSSRGENAPPLLDTFLFFFLQSKSATDANYKNISWSTRHHCYWNLLMMVLFLRLFLLLFVSIATWWWWWWRSW